MNKKILIAIIFGAIIIGLFFFYFSSKKPSNNSNYQASRTSTSENNNSENTNIEENTQSDENTQSNENTTKPVVEEQISTFSTKIYSTDPARQNNISITCGTLNDTIVKNGETFSFCNTVGQATSSKGYQKADIFDRYGNMKKGLGGGNCQISTTLYNAILAVPTLVVTERHEHSNYVPYIEKGKDAAVAYGSYDLQFRNDSGNDVKILASTDGSNVTITLNSLK